MTTYQFIRDYKNNNKYRMSFNNLAKKTFGIDFEAWYQQGFWDDNYICYSFIKDDEIVSNVSLSTMELIIDGKIQKAIQIGTVMTDPDYRRQGLAYQLINKIIEDYVEIYEMFFLAADDEAVPLYNKCGFKSSIENQYIIDLTGYRLLDKPIEPVDISPNSLLEIKKQSKPLSDILSAKGAESILMFYYTHGFRNHIYQPHDDVYVIFEIKGDMLHLYDILSPRQINLQELIEEIVPKEVGRVFCHFTPDQPIKNLESHIDKNSSWMIRTKSNKEFPKSARFPRIAQT